MTIDLTEDNDLTLGPHDALTAAFILTLATDNAALQECLRRLETRQPAAQAAQIGGERVHECVRIGREDAGHRAVLLLPPRRHDRRAELVEAGEEAIDECADVVLDARDTDLGDQLHARDSGIERRYRRRTAVEAARRGVG